MEHTGTKYESKTFREHVRLRSSGYVGSKKMTENTLWAYNKENNNFTKQTLLFPIALYNICDEIILNAIDHCLRTKDLKGKGKCNTIKFSFDKEIGKISCWNNGEGIIVEKNENGEYFIEMIFSKPMTGSNFSNDDKEKIGANGIGSKATNILSKIFIIETNDLKNKLNYNQVFENGNDIINIPTIKKASKEPYTSVSFIPDYEYFDIVYDEEFSIILEKLLLTRMVYLSTYLGNKYNIYFNDTKLEIQSLYDLAKLIVGDNLVKTNLVNKKEDKLLEVYISVWDCDNSLEHISFINGLYLSDGGTHIKYITKYILESFKTKLAKKLNDKIKVNNKLISNYLFIFFKGELNDLEYKNQSKNELSISETRFKDYEIDSKSLKLLWSKLEKKIDEVYLNQITKETTTKKSANLNGIEKYSAANYAGSTKSHLCTLFIPEGDSAESCIKNGLTSNKSLGFEYNGMFNIQGVPLNVRKEIEIKEFIKDGKSEKIIDKKKNLMKNERLMSLVKVLNLNWHFTYDDTEKGNEELKTLNYGSTIIAVDADLDGIGFICSLILNFFNVFYPSLIKRGYVKIFCTPLIRAYPKSSNNFIEEFYNVDDYDEWVKVNNVDDYQVNYIKGLATHSNMEIEYMFEDIKKNIHTFSLDTEADDYFEIYFGQDADKRKKILSTYETYIEPNHEENKENKIISCSYQLNINTKEFQLDNIQRKMPHIIDGLNPARRKVLAGSIKKFKVSNTKLKVFQLGGYIAEKMFYHHGSESLNKTIINMAQNFIGSRNIPLLLPIGQFGTHYKANDAGSPRYIDTKLNKNITDLLYPDKDIDLLEYHVIDGEVGEPKYFIPIIPTVLLEDVCLPSTGWKIEVWARDFKQVINNVKNIIADEKRDLLPMMYFKNKFKGNEHKVDNINILVGTYKLLKKNVIQVTSLPPRVWLDNYVKNIKSLDFVNKVIDTSTINDVNIQIFLKEGELLKLQNLYTDIVPHVDYIQYYFKLYVKINHQINLYNIDNTVKEFTNYEDIIPHWYIIRKKCYDRRIERECIILKYKILLCENIVKFIENHTKYKLSKKSDSEIDKILFKNKYLKINKSFIDSPGNIDNSLIVDNILNNKSNYNYLLNLSYRKMTEDSYSKLLEKIEKLNQDLKFYSKKNIYKDIWIHEIDELYKVLNEGFANGFYKENAKLFKRS